MGGKLLNGIKSIYVNSLACVRVKGGESDCFRINSGVRQGSIMSPWFFNVYMVAVMKKVKMRMGRREESGDNLASFYAVDLVLCGESEEDQRAMVGHFGEVCVEKKRSKSQCS